MHQFQSIWVHWFLKCWCWLLSSPVWSLPICLDSWTYHSSFLCGIVFLQHRTWLPPPDTSTPGHCFLFSSDSSFLLELLLYSSQVAYWAPTNLGSSSFNHTSVCLFLLFMGFSIQECWSGLHSFLQGTTFCQNSPPWPIHLGWPYTVWLIVSLS